MIEIRQVAANVFDVFVGNGWTNWSRFNVRQKSLTLVAGRPLSKADYDTVRQTLLK